MVSIKGLKVDEVLMLMRVNRSRLQYLVLQIHIFLISFWLKKINQLIKLIDIIFHKHQWINK